MDSYKWSYKSLMWVVSIVTLLITPLLTPHEPPSAFNQVGDPTIIEGIALM